VNEFWSTLNDNVYLWFVTLPFIRWLDSSNDLHLIFVTEWEIANNLMVSVSFDELCVDINIIVEQEFKHGFLDIISFWFKVWSVWSILHLLVYILVSLFHIFIIN